MRNLLSVVALSLLLAACGGNSASAPTPLPTRNSVAHILKVPSTTPPPIRGKKGHSRRTSGAAPAALPTSPSISMETPTPIPASAYTATISGRVADAQTKSPVAGALVVVENGARKARTNAFGRYSIAFPGGSTATVQVSMQGYAGELSIGKVQPHKKLQ